MTSIRMRVEYDHVKVVDFLNHNEYPVPWTKEMFAEALVVRIFDDDDTVLGYAWGHWIDVGVMSAHICAGPAGRGRILVNRMLPEFTLMAFWLGADSVYVGFPDPDHHRRARPIFLRYGAEEVDDSPPYFVINTWNANGKPLQLRRRRQAEASAAPPAAPARPDDRLVGD